MRIVLGANGGYGRGVGGIDCNGIIVKTIVGVGVNHYRGDGGGSYAVDCINGGGSIAGKMVVARTYCCNYNSDSVVKAVDINGYRGVEIIMAVVTHCYKENGYEKK